MSSITTVPLLTSCKISSSVGSRWRFSGSSLLNNMIRSKPALSMSDKDFNIPRSISLLIFRQAGICFISGLDDNFARIMASFSIWNKSVEKTIVIEHHRMNWKRILIKGKFFTLGLKFFRRSFLQRSTYMFHMHMKYLLNKYITVLISYTSISVGFSRYRLKCCSQRAPVAPSTTR